jgi:hypothetical protein
METALSTMLKFLPLILPIVIIQLALLIFCVVDLVRRKQTRGPKWVWVLVVVFVSLFGPIIYLLFGRVEE